MPSVLVLSTMATRDPTLWSLSVETNMKTSQDTILLLLQLWQQIQELKANEWKLISVPSYSQFFEAQLAACKPLELPQLSVPLHPPGIATQLPLAEVMASMFAQQ